jgi:DNA repair ATPase RecN
MVLRDDAIAGRSEIVVERDTTSDSRAYVDGIKSVSDQRLLTAVEIYSQGELQEIALSSSRRLGLIDRVHQSDVDEARDRSRKLAGSIASGGPRIQTLRETIDSAERALQEGEPIRARLEEVRAGQPTLSPDLATMRERYQTGERLLTRAGQTVEQAQRDRAALEVVVAQLQSTATAAQVLDRGVSGVLTTVARELATRAHAIAQRLESFAPDEDLLGAISDARAELDADAAPYFAARKLEEEASEALRQEDRLTEEVDRLDRISEELSAHRTQLAELETERSELRAKLAALRNEIFQRRLHQVDSINSEFSQRIILSLNQGTRTDSYRKALDRLLGGSRLRDQPALCRELAAALPPAEFIAHVENEDAVGLAQILNRDEGQMLRLISHVAGHEDLYALERDISDDELEITMIVAGRPRSVGEMSKGQKATAILPLLLRTAPYPLILDQPEDDLDNRFVYDRLVKTVAQLKHERQLIFVTHNANIPVIGDADRVFVMSMSDQDHAVVSSNGSVDEVRDEILSLLEGGKEAFELRSETYGLTDSVTDE